ncbi:MAG: hypothetical protein ACREV2_11620 [Burkholderiales bacterium]
MSKPSKVMIFLLVLHPGGCAGPEPSKPLADVPDKLKPGTNEALT